MPDETVASPTGLGRFNNTLTAVSAIVGTLGALAAGTAALMANFAKNEATEAKKMAEAAQKLAIRQQTEKVSYDYVKVVLEQLQAEHMRRGFERNREMTVAALDLIAQASGDEEGKVPPKSSERCR